MIMPAPPRGTFDDLVERLSAALERLAAVAEREEKRRAAHAVLKTTSAAEQEGNPPIRLL